VDAGDETVAGHPAIAKLIATRAAIGAVEQAVALVGNNALTRKNPLERHYRDILGATEELAWERAHRILDAIEHPAAPGAQHRGWRGANGQPENTGSQRLLAAAARGDLHDRALSTATARASGAGGNSTALVGTPDTVAQALLDYVDLGVTTLLIRGYDPLEDAVDYGRELIPLVRAEVARQDAAQAGAEAELAGRS
jgi:alkanesulfonate monooxygenase